MAFVAVQVSGPGEVGCSAVTKTHPETISAMGKSAVTFGGVYMKAVHCAASIGAVAVSQQYPARGKCYRNLGCG